MNWYHRKVELLNLGITPTFRMLKYLSLIALLDLSWMDECFYLTVTSNIEKIFNLLFKVFEQFYEESFHAELMDVI